MCGTLALSTRCVCVIPLHALLPDKQLLYKIWQLETYTHTHTHTERERERERERDIIYLCMYNIKYKLWGVASPESLEALSY